MSKRRRFRVRSKLRSVSLAHAHVRYGDSPVVNAFRCVSCILRTRQQMETTNLHQKFVPGQKSFCHENLAMFKVSMFWEPIDHSREDVSSRRVKVWSEPALGQISYREEKSPPLISTTRRRIPNRAPSTFHFRDSLLGPRFGVPLGTRASDSPLRKVLSHDGFHLTRIPYQSISRNPDGTSYSKLVPSLASSIPTSSQLHVTEPSPQRAAYQDAGL